MSDPAPLSDPAPAGDPGPLSGPAPVHVRVTLNGVPVEVAGGTTVADLVASLAPDGRGVAVAVARTVVPRSAWSAALVADGDEVEVVTAAAGG